MYKKCVMFAYFEIKKHKCIEDLSWIFLNKMYKYIENIDYLHISK